MGTWLALGITRLLFLVILVGVIVLTIHYVVLGQATVLLLAHLAGA